MFVSDVAVKSRSSQPSISGCPTPSSAPRRRHADRGAARRPPTPSRARSASDLRAPRFPRLISSVAMKTTPSAPPASSIVPMFVGPTTTTARASRMNVRGGSTFPVSPVGRTLKVACRRNRRSSALYKTPTPHSPILARTRKWDHVLPIISGFLCVTDGTCRTGSAARILPEPCGWGPAGSRCRIGSRVER